MHMHICIYSSHYKFELIVKTQEYKNTDSLSRQRNDVIMYHAASRKLHCILLRKQENPYYDENVLTSQILPEDLSVPRVHSHRVRIVI